MSTYFRCHHCGKHTFKNLRLKESLQQYCGLKACQQARKNAWEKEKLKTDSLYREKRKEQKAIWRETHRAYFYQRAYRATHPDYRESNLLSQKLRYQNYKTCPVPGEIRKIVKTDASTSAMPIQPGLYEIKPYKTCPGQKIVKTDALIVTLSIHGGMQEGLAWNPAQL